MSGRGGTTGRAAGCPARFGRAGPGDRRGNDGAPGTVSMAAGAAGDGRGAAGATGLAAKLAAGGIGMAGGVEAGNG
jgi:hypothetical protein